MNYHVEIRSGGMIYMTSFIKLGSGIQKLLWKDTHVDTQTAMWSHKPTFIFPK
jgi:hypothetical protein